MLSLLATSNAHACRGFKWETTTLLRTLPPTANKMQVVAKVAIVELLKLPWLSGYLPGGRSSLARARVIEPIKGVDAGRMIAVFTGGSSCDQVFSPHDVGRQGYVAGEFKKLENMGVVFQGQWNSGRNIKSP